MAIKIKTVTAKNFLSIGNATQAVNFDRLDLTLVLGSNLDLGGDDSGARNGTGKSALLNAVSYALYGQALSQIKKDNLINRTNGKNMLVTIEFEKNGTPYRIERGRKPNILKFFIGDVEQVVAEEDATLADSSQGDSRETQQDLIRLLGMSHEMFQHTVALNTYTEPFLNLRAHEQRSIIEQLLGITLLSEKAEKLKEVAKATRDAIQAEEIRIKAVTDANKRIAEQIEAIKRRQHIWFAKRQTDVNELRSAIDALLHINIDSEIASHRESAEYTIKEQTIAEHKRYMAAISSENDRLMKLTDKLQKEIAALDDHKCYACGQELHDTKQTEIREAKQKTLTEASLQVITNTDQYEVHSDTLVELGKLGKKPSTFYASIEEALKHQHTLETLQGDLTKREDETDPYTEQITEMSTHAIEEITYDKMNELNKLKEHQEFLLKLLTSKDSFVRKKIIDQNLSYLNGRLSYYLGKIGLPHTVLFLNDLTVEITELGRDLDFANLSRGERTRLILSLDLAFRDVWESLYHPINVLFVDELIDSGMDGSGVENSLAILKKMSRESNKSIWLVSHKDELIGRVNNVLNVVKQNGFTEYSSDVAVS